MLIPLLGNNAKRRRARILLHAQPVSRDQWRIWGGESEHIVRVLTENAPKHYACDCGRGPECSHILRVVMEIEPGRVDAERFKADQMAAAKERRQVREKKWRERQAQRKVSQVR